MGMLSSAIAGFAGGFAGNMGSALATDWLAQIREKADLEKIARVEEMKRGNAVRYAAEDADIIKGASGDVETKIKPATKYDDDDNEMPEFKGSRDAGNKDIGDRLLRSGRSDLAKGFLDEANKEEHGKLLRDTVEARERMWQNRDDTKREIEEAKLEIKLDKDGNKVAVGPRSADINNMVRTHQHDIDANNSLIKGRLADLSKIASNLTLDPNDRAKQEREAKAQINEYKKDNERLHALIAGIWDSVLPKKTGMIGDEMAFTPGGEMSTGMVSSAMKVGGGSKLPTDALKRYYESRGK